MDSRQLDRFADRLLEMVVAQQQQAAALERIAAAVEQMALVHKPVAIPAHSRHDVVIGPGREPRGISTPFGERAPLQDLGDVKLDPKRTR